MTRLLPVKESLPLWFRYYAAVDAKKERTSKHAQSFGAKNTSHNTSASQVTPSPRLPDLLFCVGVLPSCLPPGPSGVAHPPALPVPAPADPGGGVHLLPGAVRRERPLAGLHGPHHLRGEGGGPLLLPEKPQPPPRRRPAAAAGTTLKTSRREQAGKTFTAD